MVNKAQEQDPRRGMWRAVYDLPKDQMIAQLWSYYTGPLPLGGVEQIPNALQGWLEKTHADAVKCVKEGGGLCLTFPLPWAQCPPEWRERYD